MIPFQAIGPSGRQAIKHRLPDLLMACWPAGLLA
jgi:hypothetical protein